MVWIAFALMTGGVALGLIWPLSGRQAGKTAQAADLEFYRSQLAEVEDDLRRGLIRSADAEGARAEIARRLLAAGSLATAVPGGQGARSRRLVALGAALVLLPALSLGLYLRLGTPDQPDMPIASRDTGSGFDLAAAIPRIEAHLAADPNDGRGFELLAPIYLRLGRPADAVRAYSEALRLLGDTAERRAALAAARMVAADGVVSAEARSDFEKALIQQPKLPQARFFLAVAAEQDGDKDSARRLWQDLQADAPQGAPWLEAVHQHLAALSGDSPGSGIGPELSGSAAGAIAALPADQQTATIRGMVEGLAARLAKNGRDPDGWLRLMRAYMVLGDQDKARAALADGRKGLEGDRDGLARLNDGAKQLGLEGPSG